MCQHASLAKALDAAVDAERLNRELNRYADPSCVTVNVIYRTYETDHGKRQAFLKDGRVEAAIYARLVDDTLRVHHSKCFGELRFVILYAALISSAYHADAVSYKVICDYIRTMIERRRHISYKCENDALSETDKDTLDGLDSMYLF